MTLLQVCSNCGAEGTDFGTGPNGEVVCCVHCIFDPLGCRCRFGEYGVAETDDAEDDYEPGYNPIFDEADDLDFEDDYAYDEYDDPLNYTMYGSNLE